MKKNILRLFAISSLVVLAGCRSATNVGNTGTLNQNEDTEVVVNTNDNVNTNEVANENTNTELDVVSDETDTSNWLTYTNEEYGFSFRYPEEWVLEERQVDLEQSETVSILALRTSINAPSALSMNISVSKKSLDDLVDSARQYDKEISPVVFEDTFNIDGNEVIFIKKKGIDFQPFYYFVSLNNNTVLRIEFFKNYSDVISTLKFE